MKKLLCNYVILAILLLLCIELYNCVRCTKEKYAIYLHERNIIQLHDDGIIISPLTPEGAFPKDNHVLTINLKSPLSDIIGKKLEVGRDITILYDYAESGYIEVFKTSINVKLKYSKEYWANHNGTIPLRVVEK